MKKLFVSFLALAAAATAIVSCNKTEKIEPAPKDGYTYSFIINDVDTKATLDEGGVLWENKDRVGMYLDGYTGYAEIDATATPKTVTLFSRTEIPANSYAYAYYPYSTDNTDKTLNKVVFSNIQQGGTASAMPMAGIPFKVEETVPVEDNAARTSGVINFLNLGSIIDFKIFSESYTGETVKYVTFEADKTIAGEAYIDLTGVNASNEETLAVTFMDGENDFNSVKVNQEVEVAASKAEATSIYMVVAPGTYSGTITIGTDVATYTFTYTDKTLDRNVIKHYNMNLNNATRVKEVIEVVKTLPYNETFTTNIGEFEIENEILPEELSAVWTWGGADYGMKAAATTGSGENIVKYESKSLLISPWIDLTSAERAAVSFDHVHRYATSTPENELFLLVKTDEDGAEWEQLTIPTWGTGTNWNFVTAEDISLASFAGKKVKVAFKYTSTNTTAATWEIKNFSAHILKADPELAFGDGNLVIDATVNDEGIEEPELTNPHNLAVTYSSNNEEVATVGGTTGEVVIEGVAGTAVITAAFAGDDNYKAGEASYTIMVTDPSVVTVWVETAATSLATGDYVVIVDKNTAKAMSNNNGASAAPTATAITISGTKLSAEPAETIQWVVTEGDNYQFNVPGTTNYLYCTNGNNGVRVGTNTNNAFSITDNFLFNIATSRYIGVYNSAEWRCYTSINDNIKNTVLAFYKKTTQTVSGDVTLSSIAITTEPTTTFTVGNEFVFDGVVTATYSDDSTVDVTASATFSGYDMSTAGEQTVTVSYTEGETTVTTTYNITVNAGGDDPAEHTSTLTFTAACGGLGTADDNVSWTVTSDGQESSFDSTKGIHYGTGSNAVKYIKLTTSGISGTITKVVVNASVASGVTASADVTVGGVTFGGDPQTLTTTATGYTFEGSAKGEIIVTITKPESATKALYVKSVAVTYTD